MTIKWTHAPNREYDLWMLGEGTAFVARPHGNNHHWYEWRCANGTGMEATLAAALSRAMQATQTPLATIG